VTNESLTWRKSSRSAGGNCVEVAKVASGGMAVRDSKNPDGPILRFAPNAWCAFMIVLKTNVVSVMT